MTVPMMGFNPDIISTALDLANNENESDDDDLMGGALDFAQALFNPFLGNNQPGFGRSSAMGDEGQNGNNPGPFEQLLGQAGQLMDRMLNPENWEALLNGQPINGQYPTFPDNENRDELVV